MKRINIRDNYTLSTCGLPLILYATRGLNFDTLPTCDSHCYPAVTHLSHFRYYNIEKVKNRTPHGSKLTLSQNSLTPFQPNEDPTQCNAMLVCVKCFFKQLSKSEATKPN